jgi:subtilisin family serine protease
MREYIVSLKKDVDYDSFWNEIESISDSDGFAPSRRVEIVNSRNASLRLCHYFLTDEEAELLRNDPRVYGVEIPPDQRTDIEIGLRTNTQSGNFTKTTSPSGDFLNWGSIRHSFDNNVYGTSNTTTENYNYTNDGTGVDVIIHDTGIQVNHPEFLDLLDVNRVQQINWYTVSGLSGTQSANHYRDFHGHGTHVGGTVAGRLYGWAKNAKIYAIKVAGLEGPGDSGTGISITDCFDVIKLWHRNKPIDPTLGRKRPTVVNMSWGYGSTFNSINGGVYRGTPWSGSSKNTAYGMTGTPAERHPVRVASVDVDIEELIDEGVIVCVAAGNEYTKIDIPGGIDYNNYYNKTGVGQVYYHRGMSPYSSNAIIVGAMDSDVSDATTDQKSIFSNAGPGVDVFAAGSNVMSAMSTTNVFSGNTDSYHINSSFKQGNISGTSMASPQIAGITTLFLENNLTATPAQVKSWIKSKATSTIYKTNADNDYTDQRSQWGGDVKVAWASTTAGSSVVPSQGITFFKGTGGKISNMTMRRVPPRVLESFENYGFENGISGWRIVNRRVRLNGGTLIAGFPTPTDPTPNPGGGPGDVLNVSQLPIFSYRLETTDKPPSGETQCIRLTMGQPPSGFGVVPAGGIMYGPAVYSDFSVPFAAGDTVKFWWKALAGGDAYNVYSYLVNQSSGAYVQLLDVTGPNSNQGTNWTEVSKVISSGEQGTYSFVFIAGSWDSTFGTVIGGELLLDNIQIIKSTTPAISSDSNTIVADNDLITVDAN